MNAPTRQPVHKRIPVTSVDPHPQQPRLGFEPKPLERLAESMDNPQIGLIHPITVRPKWKRFELLSGERRLRAAKKAGWEEIDARIVDVDNAAALQILLVANIRAEALNCFERAQAIANLVAPPAEGGAGMTQVKVAKLLGFKHESSVSNVLRLLRLPDPWRAQMASGELEESKARLLLPFVDRPEVLEEVKRDQLANDWAWETRKAWENNLKLIEERFLCSSAPTPKPSPERAAEPRRREASTKAVGNTAARQKPRERPQASLSIDEALQVLEPYRGRADDLAAIRDAAEQLLEEIA